MDTHQPDPHIADPAEAAPDAPLAARRGSCVRARTRRERGEWRLGLLEELAEIGMEAARAIGRQVVEAVESTPPGEAPSAEVVKAETALRSASRTVRQAVALHAKLEQELEGQGGADDPAETYRRQSTKRANQVGPAYLKRRKEAVRRAVRAAIESDTDPSDRENLLSDLSERLDDLPDYADFVGEPVSVLVASICRSLGLRPDWTLFAHEPWAIEEMRLKPPGSPYADWDDGDSAGRERGPP